MKFHRIALIVLALAGLSVAGLAANSGKATVKTADCCTPGASCCSDGADCCK